MILHSLAAPIWLPRASGDRPLPDYLWERITEVAPCERG